MHHRIDRSIRHLLFLGNLAAWLLAPFATARAIPLYARQMNTACTTCHFSFPELNAFGREFKLTGYTQGTRQAVPLAAMIQASRTATANTAGADATDFPKDGSLMLQTVSLFSGGKISDHLGAFVQATSEYDGVERHTQIDNVDLRFADRASLGGRDFIYGLTANNNPTVQDVWNSTPAFRFPYISSTVAASPAAAALIDGGLGQKVAGLGAYGLWNRSLYGELSFYGTADGPLSIFRAGVRRDERVALDGAAPYWRLAYQHESGASAFEAGAFGLMAKVYPDATNATGSTNRFEDLGLDAQYQYTTDTNRVSFQASWIHEKQQLRAGLGDGSAANPSDKLDTFRLKGSYFYDWKYGGTVGYFATRGDRDTGLYAPAPITGSASGAPDSSGYVFELDYLPMQNVKVGLQYIDYRKFNGARYDYDGAGRNARDNNTLYLFGWFMF